MKITFFLCHHLFTFKEITISGPFGFFHLPSFSPSYWIDSFVNIQGAYFLACTMSQFISYFGKE